MRDNSVSKAQNKAVRFSTRALSLAAASPFASTTQCRLLAEGSASSPIAAWGERPGREQLEIDALARPLERRRGRVRISIRLCDFGSSRILMEMRPGDNYTLQGTLPFMSPLLRKELATYFTTGALPKVSHNPYKSDVFSLGYTFLILGLLRDSDCGRLLENMERNVYDAVSSLCYSEGLKRILLWMMAVEEQARPDFRELREYLREEGGPLLPGASRCVLYEWHEFRLALSDDAPVQLPCNSCHVFCSKHCFLDYVFTITGNYSKELASAVCPQCKTPISEAVVLNALGGSKEYERLRRLLTQTCLNCHRHATARKFTCYHRVCKICWTNLKLASQCPAEGCEAKRIEKCSMF